MQCLLGYESKTTMRKHRKTTREKTEIYKSAASMNYDAFALKCYFYCTTFSSFSCDKALVYFTKLKSKIKFKLWKTSTKEQTAFRECQQSSQEWFHFEEKNMWMSTCICNEMFNLPFWIAYLCNVHCGTLDFVVAETNFCCSFSVCFFSSRLKSFCATFLKSVCCLNSSDDAKHDTVCWDLKL